MATIASQKAALEKWAPLIIFDVTLKDGTPRYWAKQAVTFAGHSYIAIVLEHSELKLEGNGVYGVDAVAQIGLTLNNADSNLNALITPANWQGGVIQPRFIFVAPDGTTTTDSIVYPKFLADLPTSTWPRIEFSAHNKWNLARKMLPASLVTKKDRYPFPDTAAERTAAGSDPTSPFFALGYDPATGKGIYKTGSTPYTRAEYDGTREKLKEIGLEVRFGGFGKVPPTVVGTPKKGEKSDYIGNANEAKYGQAVPLVFGICRIQPIVLDTGFPSGIGGWNGARLSHYLLSDGVSFGPEASMGIEDVLDVFIPDSAKYQRIVETSNEPSVTGAWSFQGGYYGSQKAPASSKYRNIDQSIDFPDPKADFIARDLYSGLAYLEIGFPKELSGEDGIGPKLEAIVKGLKIETWDSGGSSTWQWTDNPVWIFVHLLKLLRWTTADMDKPTIAAAAAYCDAVIGSGKKRFRCNLALMNQTKAADVLRGVRNNCRMYTSFASDGKLQLKIAQNVAGEGGLAFTLDTTTIMRGDDGQLKVEKFHRSVFETANVFSSTFQNEQNAYNSDSVTMTDVSNVNQIDEKISADSIFPMLGIPSFDQAERQLEWARQEQVTLNEYYRVTASFALIEAKVGQVGTITEPRHALISQQVRIRAMAPGPDAGTVELVLQKHSDGAYTDQSVSTPFTRAQADSSYTPRSVGGKFASSPAPILTEVIVADPAGDAIRRIKVEFKPPSRDFEGIFSRETKISNVVVATSGGSIPGAQVLFVEVAPVKAGVRGLASEYLMAVVPSGGNLNTISLTCELPPEADQYILFVGNFPGQTYEQTLAASPGTAPFTITVTSLIRNFGSIPPDPAFDHVSIFYRYNSSPNVLRDGGRTFSPTETTLEFEPESPAGNDTQVTVYASSTNAAEDDFYPIEISPKATLTLTQEAGKAMGWTATLLPGPTPSSVIPKFTRPTTNGKRLFWVAGQLKDSSVGVWRETDENAGASVVYYDGSAIDHESVAGKIKKDPSQPLGFGTANIDDLIMLDVAGGSFDIDRCQWGTVAEFQDDLGATTTAAGARYIVVNGLFRPQTTQGLRMKICKPHHTWDTEGYLGSPSGAPFNGVFWEWIGDREGDEFILSPVEIGRDISSVDVRFWLENDYCRSGGGKTVSTNAVQVKAVRDNVLPGQVENLLVVAHGPEFIATWNDPLTGKSTLDDAAVQYATDFGFTTDVITAGGLGHVNRATGLDPGKTYYFRVAVRNQSGLTNHADTTILGTLGWGTTGWGPWKAFGAPTSVTSSASTGPVDSVIPGPVVSLVVTGANGNFVADWLDPATGNLTLDDIGIEWATNPGFTVGVERAKGWGPINHVQSTLPGKTFYFRVAAHNQSGAASDSGTAATLGSTGWGPWTAYGVPTAVSSGGIPGGMPTDSVIPGTVETLLVVGSNGDFTATWNDPATGNLTLDDTAILWATNQTFTAGVQTASGWGKVNRLKSTDPEKRYYFQVALHNQSGQPSHSGTASLGATGWGPWTYYGAPASAIPVESGTVPGAGWTSTGENLCPNFSFEYDTDGDGIPDDCTYPFIVSTPVAGAGRTLGVSSNGNYSFKLPAGTDNAVALGGFAVTPGERLTISARVLTSAASSFPGIYIRAFFHSTTRQFGTQEAIANIVAGAVPQTSGAFILYEEQITVPAGMHWCRIVVQNFGAPVDYYYDDIVVLRTVQGPDIDDNTVTPGNLTGAARLDFIETFEIPLGDAWIIDGSGAAGRSYAGAGVDGGFVLQGAGALRVYSTSIRIPYNPRTLYRISARVRHTAIADTTKDLVIIGVICLNISGVDIGHLHCTADFKSMHPETASGSWRELTGWIKGVAGPTGQEAPDSTNPNSAYVGTVWVSPLIALNWDAGNAGNATTGNVMQIDDYRIEAFDEDIYTSDVPNGTFSSLTKAVFYPFGDAMTSAVSLYWDYTQGLDKAQQFAITITDGTAYWVHRVRCLAGTGALRHQFNIHRLIFNRAVTISIKAEAVRMGGQVESVGSATWGTFTPNAASGTAPGGQTDVGTLDWAGGNIWYDSLQYRNNTPPDNAPSGSITITPYHSGSAASRIVITGFGYTQGANIATHLAVYLKAPSGTINLYSDMVVARISTVSLPSSFEIPITLDDNQTYSVAVVAVAMTKNGASPKTTFPTPTTKAATAISVQCVNSPYQVHLAQQSNLSESIFVWRPLRLERPYGNIHCYEGTSASGTGGTERAVMGADSGGLYLWNGAYQGITVKQGVKPNIIFGNWSVTPNAAHQHCIYITDGANLVNEPTGGGYLVSISSTLYWITPSNARPIGPAGPHCGKCGYDDWLVGSISRKWQSYLFICGRCGERYEKGPKTILHLLDKQEKSEIIRHGKPLPKEIMKMLTGKEESDAQDQRPQKTRSRRRGIGRRRKAGQNRMRRV